jgi:hypothetical protein
MTTITQIADLARHLGIETKIWNKADRLRLYAKTQKHLSVYLELDGTPDLIEGGAFKVFCNTEGQHPNWLKSQVSQARARHIALFHAYVVTQYSDTGPSPNGYGPDINDMIDESRAFVAAYEAELNAE